ncbi:Predicted O-linked N-acetylglucosamine transferase, SPINDLY family [Polynucleobacter kasalickyi]|uniref:protein O-GlcNAc transferase n=2 Tax=Polynucleobacter kasalickyi TaxID=1938817 RepID=A0A1W2BYP5_9BURK|nr:Predicted O-linked N-acetylglucosamine transferase, SPINDLY family [Polynucleobacter kasalickyi]
MKSHCRNTVAFFIVIETGKNTVDIMKGMRPPLTPTSKSNAVADAEIAFQENRYVDVIEILKTLPQHTARSNELMGYCYGRLGNLKETEKYLLAASKKTESSIEVFYYLGLLYLEKNKTSTAINYLKTAISKYDHFYEAHYLLGTALVKINKLDEALKHYLKALTINSHSADLLFNLGNTYEAMGEVNIAITYYEKALEINPSHINTILNFGVIQGQLGNHAKALDCFKKLVNATHIDHLTLADAHTNLGLLYSELGHYAQAEKSLQRSIELNPLLAESFYHLGILNDQQKSYELANHLYKKAYQLEPNKDYVMGRYTVSNQLIGQWGESKDLIKKIEESVQLKKNIINPLDLLYISDQPKLHFECVKTYSKKRLITPSSPFQYQAKDPAQKIKIAYVSPDFKNHAVTNLTAELFELHDRTAFEVIGISIKKQAQNDQMRERVMNAFDTFYDLEDTLSDDQLLELCRTLNIDIAIDLAGHTLHSRPSIFKQRIAPIQMSYLGFLGSLGFENMDYLIADKTIVPETISQYFYEKMMYLPECFQINDSRRIRPVNKVNPPSLGLPEDGFIFACLNNRIKVTPKIFHAWLAMLKATSNTFLWLISESPESDDRLKKMAQKESIEPSRIIFTNKLPFEDYLASYLSADLFLDTYPYNGGTTISDALWMGLPVLTLSGQSMPSRMGKSLLKNCGLEELVTESLDEYIALAISLASSPSTYQHYHELLAKTLSTAPLFDTPRTVQYIESGYKEAMRQFTNNLGRKNIEVKPVEKL